MRRFLGPIIYEITKGIAKAFGVDNSTIQIAFWLIVGALILVAICIGIYEKKEKSWCNRKNNHTDGSMYITQVPKDNSCPSNVTTEDNQTTKQMPMNDITKSFENMFGSINRDK